MECILTSLPVADNDGRSTLVARTKFYRTLELDGVKFYTKSGCYGIWFGADGTRYAEETEVVLMDGDSSAIHRALAQFGVEARQLAVLAVALNDDAVVALDYGVEGADALAREHGGATRFPNGIAVSFRYNALEAGTHYSLPVEDENEDED